MKIYICWSGNESKFIAESLADWLPLVLNALDPWISSQDIEAGRRWNSELTKQLEESNLGILCLRKTNLSNPWILLEAGALSKISIKSKVIPFLTDLEKTNLSDPLAMFQAAQGDKGGAFELVKSLNNELKTNNEVHLSDEKLKESFDQWWPNLERKMSEIPLEPDSTEVIIKTDREILEEILATVREIRYSTENERELIYSKRYDDEIRDLLFHSVYNELSSEKDISVKKINLLKYFLFANNKSDITNQKLEKSLLEDYQKYLRKISKDIKNDSEDN